MKILATTLMILGIVVWAIIITIKLTPSNLPKTTTQTAIQNTQAPAESESPPEQFIEAALNNVKIA